ncbi:MAG: hypothetical protein J0M26_00725 [Planctomycetes bacterium]|nr:hypothetical protein [Planctomycetota bacterium]
MDSQRLRVSLRTWLLGVVVFPTIILGITATLAKRNGYRLAWTTRTQRSLEVRVGGGALAHRRAKINAYLPWTRELIEFRDGTILTLVHWPTVHPRIIIAEEEEQSSKNATLDEQWVAGETLDQPF